MTDLPHHDFRQSSQSSLRRCGYDGCGQGPNAPIHGLNEKARINNPWLDAAQGVELSMRVRKALMTVDDWSEIIERYLEQGS